MLKALIAVAAMQASFALAGTSMLETPKLIKPPVDEVAAKCQPQKTAGKITGYKCVLISEQSNYRKAGLIKDDVVVSVDQVKLDSPASAMKMFQTIDNGSCKEIVISRAGKEMTLKPTFK